jgi:hypothetical protein
MKAFLFCIIALASVISAPAFAQSKAKPINLATIDKPKAWKTINVIANPVERDGREGAYLKSLADSANGIVGLALPIGVEFDTGVIELELKGKSERGRSFLGAAFNMADEKTFEAIYFRPFNFKADEPFRGRAVQYISWPANTWEKLRKDHPNQFEQPVNPVPDPDDWFRARIEVSEKQVRVFVNDAKSPSLVVDRLATGKAKRAMGLFVDSADGLYANVRVTPGK